MTCSGFQGQPLLWGKVYLLLCPCAVPEKLAELEETQWGLQQDFLGWFVQSLLLSQFRQLRQLQGCSVMRTHMDGPGTSPAHLTHVNNQLSSGDRAWFTCRWHTDWGLIVFLQNWFRLFFLIKTPPTCHLFKEQMLCACWAAPPAHLRECTWKYSPKPFLPVSLWALSCLCFHCKEAIWNRNKPTRHPKLLKYVCIL